MTDQSHTNDIVMDSWQRVERLHQQARDLRSQAAVLRKQAENEYDKAAQHRAVSEWLSIEAKEQMRLANERRHEAIVLMRCAFVMIGLSLLWVIFL